MKGKKQNNYGTLYVVLDNDKEKRKTILGNTKKVLELQNDIEKVLKIRLFKEELLKNIKEMIFSMNEDLQKIQKSVPNVKNMISYTEKEIKELEKSVSMIKNDIEEDNARLKETSKYIEKMERNLPADLVRKKISKSSVPKKGLKEEIINKKKISKEERIQNNLKVIESKLNSL